MNHRKKKKNRDNEHIIIVRYILNLCVIFYHLIQGPRTTQVEELLKKFFFLMNESDFVDYEAMPVCCNLALSFRVTRIYTEVVRILIKSSPKVMSILLIEYEGNCDYLSLYISLGGSFL